MKSLACLLLIISLFSIELKAQPYLDLADLKYTYFNQAPMKANMNATVDVNMWSGGFFLPLPLKNNNRLIIGADNSTINGKYNSSDTAVSYHLSTTSMQLGLLKQWKNQKWNTLFLLIPRQAADFKDTKSTDFQMGGACITTYKKNDKLKFKFGLYYNREFFGNYFMPLAGLEWRVNDKLDLWATMPGSLGFAYKLGEKVTIGIKYQSNTATYRSEGSDGKTYIREGDEFFSDQQLSLKGDYYITKNLVFYAGAGMSVFHYFQQYNEFNKKVTVLPQFQASRDRGFLYAGLAFRVKTD